MNSAIQRTVWDSISVAAGDSIQAPTFWVYSRGEKIAENPDRRRWSSDVSEETRVTVEQRVSEQQFCCLVPGAAAGSMPAFGSGPVRSSASRTIEGDSSGVTGPRGNDSRNPAIWSTSRCPSLRNIAASIASGACRTASPSTDNVFLSVLSSCTDPFKADLFPVSPPLTALNAR